MKSETNKIVYKIDTKLDRISRVTLTKIDYKPEEVRRIPFIIKLPQIPFDIEYIKPIESQMMFFVKLKNVENAVIIKFFEWMSGVTKSNEIQIDYLIRRINWPYDNLLIDSEGKDSITYSEDWVS